MVDKEFIIKSVNAYKLVSIMSVLACAKNDILSIKCQYKILKSIWNKLLDSLKDDYSDEVICRIKVFDTDGLGEELEPLKTIDLYNRILSLKFLNVQTELKYENILLNKMSIDLNPSGEFGYIGIAKILLEDKKYHEALELCNYLKTFSETAPLWEISADAYRGLKDYGNAVENYKKYIEKNDGDEDVVVKLNETYKEALNYG